MQIGIPSLSPLANHEMLRDSDFFSWFFLSVSVIVQYNLWYNGLRCGYEKILYHYRKDSARKDSAHIDSLIEREVAMLPSDPDMLASFLNMKLRDQYASLDALCEDLELDRDEIVAKLREADYDYVPARNQFL